MMLLDAYRKRGGLFYFGFVYFRAPSTLIAAFPSQSRLFESRRNIQSNSRTDVGFGAREK